MKVAYIDCVGGASGDMLLSALLDAGAHAETLQLVIDKLGLKDCSVQVERVMQGALSALHVEIVTPQKIKERHATELIAIIAEADLSQEVKEKALVILNRLAESESRIHNQPVDKIHLHELGGDDTLIDIVGVLSLLEELGIEKVYSSPLPVARGFTQSMHGTIPLPAPATLALLEKATIRFVDSVEAELVTPTGAVLVTSLAEGYDGFPNMKLLAVGIGAGRRQMPFPNITRLWIGETKGMHSNLITETLSLLETNIDDLNPQVYEHVTRRLFEAGALDVTLTTIQMKKNRSGQMVSILCRPADIEQMQTILFEEKITLGIRNTTCERVSLPRSLKKVETPYGEISVKFAYWGDETRMMPEYEDCRHAAEKNHVPLVDVMAAALASSKAQQRNHPDLSQAVIHDHHGERKDHVRKHEHPHHDHDEDHHH